MRRRRGQVPGHSDHQARLYSASGASGRPARARSPSHPLRTLPGPPAGRPAVPAGRPPNPPMRAAPHADGPASPRIPSRAARAAGRGAAGSGARARLARARRRPIPIPAPQPQPRPPAATASRHVFRPSADASKRFF
jgi:hypothetical protein